MNTEKTFYYFHGSPGVPEEFDLIKPHLPGAKVLSHARPGYPGATTGEAKILGDTVLVGYSWGSVPCLLEARKNIDRVEGVILISPYIFPVGRVNPVKKFLMSAPLVGPALLKKLGPKVIDDMLEKSSSPRKVPPFYKKVAPKMAHPRALQMATTEKKRVDQQIRDVFKFLSAGEVPVAVIWGEKDQTIREIDQIDPLRYWINLTLEEKIEDGGHALPWTHPAEVGTAIKKFIDLIHIKEK